MEAQLANSHFPPAALTPSIFFAIDLIHPGALEPTAINGSGRYSIVVWIEPQDVLFILSAPEPEKATRTFAEALAKRTALSAIEKDIPNGVELSVSAKQIDYLPPEIENRIPDFYMNGNKAWLVAPPGARAELAGPQSVAA